MVSSTPRPHFTPGKDPVPIVREAEWAPGPVWTGGKSRPHRDSIPDRPARSQALYRLSYPAHSFIMGGRKMEEQTKKEKRRERKRVQQLGCHKMVDESYPVPCCVSRLQSADQIPSLWLYYCPKCRPGKR